MFSKESFYNPKQKQLGVLSSGERVYDRKISHLVDNQDLYKYLEIALEKINPNEREFIVESVSFETPIGVSICVETELDDEILYAQRPNRSGLTRFVKNKIPKPTSDITIVLKKVEDVWIVITAYIGPKAEKEPWDPLADEESIKFWETHALVWGSTDVISGTEKTDPNSKT